MRGQEGQVLPIGLALLVFGSLGALVLFNTGQLATDKMKLANTADAAAYSGSLWQARALNFQSYTNRAMVANQVSIAQAVTLQSWVAYGAVASENIATVLKPVPVINVVAEGLQRGLEIVERVVSPVAQALLSVVDAVNRGLSLAQQAMYVSTFVATPDVMRSVVDQTDERFTINSGFSGLGLAQNLNQWRSFTEGFTTDDVAAMDERVQMINNSRDRFSQQRNWKFFNFWFYSTPLLRHQIRREGTTELIRVDGEDGAQWEWKAKDAMSLHNRLWHWKGTKRYEVPIGWAEAFANTKNAARTLEPGACTSVAAMRHGDCERFLGINRHGEYLADIGQRSAQGQETRIAMSHYTGVQAYRSLSTLTREQEQPRIRLKVEVGLPDVSVRSSDALGSGGVFEVPVQAPGDVLSSVSVAEVFYLRPDEISSDHAGASLEPANGYNPYWGARLSPVAEEDRLLAFAMRSHGDGNQTPSAGSAGLPDSPSGLTSYQETQAGQQGSNTALVASESTSGETAFATEFGDFDTVVAAQAREGLNGFREDIESRLLDVLRQQVGQMLAGAVTGSSTGSIQSVEDMEDELLQMASNEVGDLASVDAAAPYIDAVNEATAMAEQLEEEFRAIRERIVEGFQSIYDEAVASLDSDMQPLIERREDLNNRLNASFVNEDRQRELRQGLAEVAAEMTELRQQLRQDLAMSLRELVNESTDLYVMRMSEAYYLVDEFLRTDEETISLPWLEWVEEDDIDE